MNDFEKQIAEKKIVFIFLQKNKVKFRKMYKALNSFNSKMCLRTKIYRNWTDAKYTNNKIEKKLCRAQVECQGG